LKKLVKALIIYLVLVGLVIAVINFASPTLRAGYIETEGTFPGDRLWCPGEPSNCVHRIYVDDNQHNQLNFLLIKTRKML